MTDVTWAEAVQAVGAIATPVAAGVIAIVFAQRQSRSEALLATRLDYYKSIAPKLNKLMCYLTFIGDWKLFSPTEIVALKRQLDREMRVAAPLFSPLVLERYDHFSDLCFVTFGLWGDDAKIRSSAYRRRLAFPTEWHPGWDHAFAVADTEPIPGATLQTIRETHDAVIAAMTKDLSMTRARSKYTTDLVVLNAHSPAPRDVAGAPS